MHFCILQQNPVHCDPMREKKEFILYQAEMLPPTYA